MSRLTESELKLGLPDELAWEWVRAQLGPGPVVRQDNHFFDREDRALGDRRIGVRLRSEGDRRTLTVKADRISGLADPITHRLELEEPIDPEEFERSLTSGLALGPAIDRWRTRPARDPAERDDLAELLDGLDSLARNNRLQRFGGFSNRRERLCLVARDAQGSLEIEIELDRTEYPGGHLGFEIEVEADAGQEASLPRAHAALVQWLDRAGGIQTTTVDSKLARLNAILESQAPGASSPSTGEG